MLTRYIAIFLIVGICLVGNLSLTHSVSAETLFQSTVETRLMIWLRVEQTELQKLLPAQWQVTPIPGGPFKEANFVIAFNDVFLVQDPQGKPDKGGIARKAVFVVPAKHTQTGEMASVVTGGLTADSQDVPGAYKNFSHATIRREQTSKVVNIEAGLNEDFWEVRGDRGGIIELRVQYQAALPSRAKAEQKIYSAVEPAFYRIYRADTATDIVKSVPAGKDRVKNYQFRMAVPELSKLFDGTEKLVGISVIPLYVRQIFLP